MQTSIFIVKSQRNHIETIADRQRKKKKKQKY